MIMINIRSWSTYDQDQHRIMINIRSWSTYDHDQHMIMINKWLQSAYEHHRHVINHHDKYSIMTLIWMWSWSTLSMGRHHRWSTIQLVIMINTLTREWSTYHKVLDQHYMETKSKVKLNNAVLFRVCFSKLGHHQIVTINNCNWHTWKIDLWKISRTYTNIEISVFNHNWLKLHKIALAGFQEKCNSFRDFKTKTE